MGFADNYLIRYSIIGPQITEPPSGLLRFIIVIPAYLEDQIFSTLRSLLSADPPDHHVEVIVIVNHPVSDIPENKEKNKNICDELVKWCQKNSFKWIRFHVLYAPDLPKKHAGAGLARKIGMDEAIHRFNRLDLPSGFILSLDADSTLDKNYFTELERALSDDVSAEGCIFYFEHPIEGIEFSSDVYTAVVKYELYLRYYHHALQRTGYPYYQYTIGACFGVNASAYVAQGGMNRRQAGEDFYFLHKLFPNRKFIDITATCVHPSPRPSFRVPFGTGPVINQLTSGELDELYTYHPAAFEELREMIFKIPLFYDKEMDPDWIVASLPASIANFLDSMNFSRKIVEIRNNTASKQTFEKRFYQWFDGFMVVKYLNVSHSGFYSKLPVGEAVKMLLKALKIDATGMSEEKLLLLFREADQKNLSLETIF